MASKHANILDDKQFQRLLLKIAYGDHGLRSQVILLLSYKAGLRAQEIAGLCWRDVCDAEGSVREDYLLVPGSIAKGGHERKVPMHMHLHSALSLLHAERPGSQHIIYGLKAPSVRKGAQRRPMRIVEHTTPSAMCMWLRRLYEKEGFQGCSSHSGRRTFITNLARKCGKHDCSIRDVQSLAGHASMKTTERYIEPSANVNRLVAAV